MEKRVEFRSGKSGNLNISGIVHMPDDLDPGEKRPAVLVLHGFGSRKDADNVTGPTNMFMNWGYIVLRFDMRGCGESDGLFGHLLCLDQVEDTQAGVTFMQSLPQVDPNRIAVVGSSFGAAVAVYTAGVDNRISAVISSGGWGNGERKFRGQHPAPDEWAAFTNLLQEGKKHRAETGEPMMVDRHAIVPIPEHLRKNMPAGSVQQFTADTAQGMMEFNAENVIGNIAPRPVLLLHSSIDSVTPTEQSVEMFKRSGQPTDLHLTADTDHFMMAESNTRVINIINDWLAKYFPVKVAGDA
ncbi:MAG: alpha/beta fold hydrolase [Pseudomonadota bacterium]|nr:alpha/beta fold hydrolase [Pseudomonadota bacterium]